jgi:CheY-like chemotaxis protein
METILIAEDEAPIRKMLAEVLRQAGYRVIAAGNGQDAISTAARNAGSIDLLVTDIVMSGMGGAELYTWLKSERPDLKVLFISGMMSREPLEGAFLKKPFLPSQFLEKVRELLSPKAA